MKRKNWRLAGVLSVLLLSGAPTDIWSADMTLRDNIGVGDVRGGGEADRRWEAAIGSEKFQRALKRSLDAAGFLERARGEGRYSLSAVLESIAQPDVGSSVVTVVKYTLREKRSGRDLYQESVSCEYTMASWDSFMRPNLLKALSENAALANIALLIEKLSRLDLPRVEVSLSQ